MVNCTSTDKRYLERLKNQRITKTTVHNDKTLITIFGFYFRLIKSQTGMIVILMVEVVIFLVKKINLNILWIVELKNKIKFRNIGSAIVKLDFHFFVLLMHRKNFYYILYYSIKRDIIFKIRDIHPHYKTKTTYNSKVRPSSIENWARGNFNLGVWLPCRIPVFTNWFLFLARLHLH